MDIMVGIPFSRAVGTARRLDLKIQKWETVSIPPEILPGASPVKCKAHLETRFTGIPGFPAPSTTQASYEDAQNRGAPLPLPQPRPRAAAQLPPPEDAGTKGVAATSTEGPPPLHPPGPTWAASGCWGKRDGKRRVLETLEPGTVWRNPIPLTASFQDIWGKFSPGEGGTPEQKQTMSLRNMTTMTPEVNHEGQHLTLSRLL
ncbi:uncharacterized protein LOC130456927 [Monodelphis domestica]|uniref:uncharacterized protein LOC130456927 n=1 Tax=Monodelphis domestica TaxID=13616 RepID=UPI0024E1A483|nr:uncharacterized protein LOC130456927 [Monodelphis domestica]